MSKSPCGSCTGGNFGNEHCGFPCNEYQNYYRRATGFSLYSGVKDMNNGWAKNYGPNYQRTYKRIA